jgi:hypothetical protein
MEYLMTTQVLLELSDREYEQAQRLAHTWQQDVAAVLKLAMGKGLPLLEESGTLTTIKPADDAAIAQQKAALRREKVAYFQLHSELKKKYLGQYVAIYNEAMVDVDPDFGTLYERVRSRFPDQVILMTQVNNEPVETIMVRSPRLVPIRN